MRSLCITLHTKDPVTLPLAYNELIQGLLYSCWRGRYPEFHDDTTNQIRKFVFGRLEGKCRVNAQTRTIRFSDLVEFEVRTPYEELLDECAAQLASRGKAQLGAYELDLVNLQSKDRLIFPSRATIRMITPVVEYRTKENHTIPISPMDMDWISLVQANTQKKAAELGIAFDAPFQAIAFDETMRKQVTRFKGTYVTGWTGKLMLAADPSIVAMLWCCGLGAKNSQGFGLFDIDVS